MLQTFLKILKTIFRSKHYFQAWRKFIRYFTSSIIVEAVPEKILCAKNYRIGIRKVLEGENKVNTKKNWPMQRLYVQILMFLEYSCWHSPNDGALSKYWTLAKTGLGSNWKKNAEGVLREVVWICYWSVQDILWCIAQNNIAMKRIYLVYAENLYLCMWKYLRVIKVSVVSFPVIFLEKKEYMNWLHITIDIIKLLHFWSWL